MASIFSAGFTHVEDPVQYDVGGPYAPAPVLLDPLNPFNKKKASLVGGGPCAVAHPAMPDSRTRQDNYSSMTFKGVMK